MKDNYAILYIDDELLNLQLFEANFKRKYKVYKALSAEEGLEMLQANTDIDVVICDLKMPGMNGIEFIKKAKLSYDNILFFLMSGYEITDDIQIAVQEGLITRYFCKPYSVKEIEAAITQAFSA